MGAGTTGEGPSHDRYPSVRQRGPDRYSVTDKWLSELLSSVSGVSAEREREGSRDVVRLFSAEPKRNQNGRVCNVCNRVWLCRAEHI